MACHRFLRWLFATAAVAVFPEIMVAAKVTPPKILQTIEPRFLIHFALSPVFPRSTAEVIVNINADA